MIQFASRAAFSALILITSLSSTASAGVIFNAQEVGSDVIISAAGTLVLPSPALATGIAVTGGAPSGLDPDLFIATGGNPSPGPSTLYDAYLLGSYTGPVNFGSGTSGFEADSWSGDFVFLQFDSGFPVFFVPTGYVSGDQLASTSTYDGQTFATLGMTVGSYTWEYDSGSDFFTLIAVPEPTSLACLLGLVGMCALRRRR